MIEIDLAIVGAGVAGLSAARAAAGEGVKTLVIERLGAGGQVMNIERIENFPAFPEGVAGYELGPMLQMEAEEAGAQFLLDRVEGIDCGADGRHILCCEAETVCARAVIVAAGSRLKPLGVAREDALAGRGVSHCASCDGPMFRGQTVCVVGGGDSAFQEAVVLASHAARVLLVFREPQPHAQPYLQAAVAALPNIDIVAGAEVSGIAGDDGVRGVVFRRGAAPPEEVPVHGVFVYAGLIPETAFLGDAVKRDAAGRIETGADHETSHAGVFAAGDIRSGARYRLEDVAQEGRAAARAACRYLETNG